LFRTQNDLEAARKEIQLQQTELSRLREQLSQKEQIHLQLETQLIDKDESKKNDDLLTDQYRQQLTNEKELRTSKNKKKRQSLLFD
jgi:hypothetical protein